MRIFFFSPENPNRPIPVQKPKRQNPDEASRPRSQTTTPIYQLIKALLLCVNDPFRMSFFYICFAFVAVLGLKSSGFQMFFYLSTFPFSPVFPLSVSQVGSKPF
mmetsp:Transcript_43316/g.112625  ORF Transcript_43316/g.112625 Transcript_43316/m.112625 type:complete len:104 (-) Transcript_43316:2772-3083(-)